MKVTVIGDELVEKDLENWDLGNRDLGKSDFGKKDSGDKDGVPLRVMTYNIRKCVGMDGKFDIDRLANVIREAAPDVAGLQEVAVHWDKDSEFADTIRLLADKLGMYYYFGPFLEREALQPGQPIRQFGRGVLSKYPIVHADNLTMTRTADTSPPQLPMTVIEKDGVKFKLYSVHLVAGDTEEAKRLRAKQAEELIGYAAKEGGLQIFVGDLNAEPQDSELVALCNAFNDAWELKGTGSGLTFPATYPPGKMPLKRIDYIIATKDIEIRSARVIPTFASDHDPVVADLVLPVASK